MTVDLDDLERKLAAATEGSWEPEEMTSGGAEIWGKDRPGDRGHIGFINRYNDAVFVVALRNIAAELISELRAARAARKMLEDLVDDGGPRGADSYTTDALVNVLQRRIRNAENDAARGAEMAVIAHQLATQIAERTKYAWDDHVRRIEHEQPRFLITAAQAEALGFTSNKLTEGQMDAMGIEPADPKVPR